MSKKKMSIIYVLRILKTCSSCDYPLSQSLLTKAINLAGIKCDRKTVARDIDCLIKCGYKIIKYKGGGCYLYDENELNNDDLLTLIDTVKNSDLKHEEKQSLLKKITRLKKEVGITSPKKGSFAYLKKLEELSTIRAESVDNVDDFIYDNFEE